MPSNKLVVKPPAAPLPVRGDMVVLGVGVPKLGCFAVSASTQSAACIIGTVDRGESTFELAFVGSKRTPIPIGAKVEAATAAAANAILTSDAFISAPAFASLKADEKLEFLVKGPSSTPYLKWTETVIGKGGNNSAPTKQLKLVADTMGMGEPPKTVFDDTLEGASVVADWALVGTDNDAAYVVQFHIHTEREGEVSDSLEVVALNQITGDSSSTKR